MSKPCPNLFLIGAMKSGTSSLHACLDKHPQIFMSKPKEPMFFSRESNFAKGEESYLALFASAGEALVIGESSTEYSKAPMFMGVPQRIAKFNSEARFIYVMRDPIERTISQYWFKVQHLGERQDMLRSIREDSHYTDLSHYAMQLTPYFEIFGRDRIFTLTFEEMRDDTSNVIQTLFKWLGVDSTFIPQNLQEKRNVTPKHVIQARYLGLSTHFGHSQSWKSIKSLVPRPIRLIGRKISEKRIDRESVSVDKAIEFLRPIQLEQTQALSKLLNRSFPEWTTLNGTNSSMENSYIANGN